MNEIREDLIVKRGKTFIVFMALRIGGSAIKCLKCNMISYNQNDVSQEYCGNCSQFHSFLAIEHQYLKNLEQDLSQNPQ